VLAQQHLARNRPTHPQIGQGPDYNAIVGPKDWDQRRRECCLASRALRGGGRLMRLTATISKEGPGNAVTRAGGNHHRQVVGHASLHHFIDLPQA